MPWISSHLDADSHLGEDPAAQSVEAATQDAAVDNSELTAPVASLPAKIMGLSKQQWLVIAAAAIVTIMILKNRR